MPNLPMLAKLTFHKDECYLTRFDHIQASGQENIMFPLLFLWKPTHCCPHLSNWNKRPTTSPKYAENLPAGPGTIGTTHTEKNFYWLLVQGRRHLLAAHKMLCGIRTPPPPPPHITNMVLFKHCDHLPKLKKSRQAWCTDDAAQQLCG